MWRSLLRLWLVSSLALSRKPKQTRGDPLMPRLKVSYLIAEITEEMGKGQIFEAPIVGSKDHVEGLCNWESGDITVNPAPSVVDTLIHELLHRRFPKWSEERVRVETWRIIRTLSAADVQALHNKYKRIAKRRRKPVRLRNAEV